MSREELAAESALKKETLNKTISGKSKTRALTRRRIIEDGFGVSPEFFARIEYAIANGIDPATVREDDAGRIDTDAKLTKILEHVTGLPLPVARSIVKAFDEDGEQKSPGEIEDILRRKANEYQELKAQIQMLRGDDPRVNQLRGDSLRHIEAGRFDDALVALREALGISKAARHGAEQAMRQRRLSEGEILLSQAKLTSLMSHYSDAVSLCFDAYTVVRGVDHLAEGRTLVAAARYLALDANEHGHRDSERTAIARIENDILPFAPPSLPELRAEIRYHHADLYSLLGYRTNDKSTLLVAAKMFRQNLTELSRQDTSEQYLNSATRLGDTHTEIALARDSVTQARLGVSILRCGIEHCRANARPVTVATSYIRLGTALANLGLLSNDLTHFEEAREAYESAIELVDDKMDRSVRARAQWGLAIAFADHGARSRSIALLKRSEAACNQAMVYLTRDRYPVDWATLVNNRGNARLERGKLENGSKALLEAIADYDASLEVRTPDRFQLGFIKSKGNRAVAMRVLAERQGNLQLAQDAKNDLEHVVSLTAGDSYWARYYGDELARAKEAVEILSTSDHMPPIVR